MRRVLPALLLIILTVPAVVEAAKLLPTPLKLPPGRFQVLPIQRSSSYMADAVKILNCPDDKFNPLGTCGDVRYGGLAMFATPLEGFIQARFFPPVNNVSHFEISHPGNLKGPDAIMRAPILYAMALRENTVIDPLGEFTTGDLNLLTGEVKNLNYQVLFFNSFYNAFGAVNPRLKPPTFQFPGIYGSAQLTFEQRADGLLDITFMGSTFLPLGKDISGEPPRIPLPFCGPLLQCSSIEAPGASLHPRLQLSTKAATGAPCGSNCPDTPSNTVQQFSVYAYNSSFGDDFTLNIPQLGGIASGRSHLQGRIQVQFGERTGDFLPVAINTLPPPALFAEPPAAPPPLNLFTLGLIGHDEKLRFPNYTYETKQTVLLEDSFDLPMGVIDLKTGRLVGGLIYRGLPVQDLLVAIINANLGRIPTDTFRFRGPASFEKGPGGETVFRYDASVFLDFETFTFPRPDYNPAFGWISGPGSDLQPFLRMQAMRQPDGPRPTFTMTASGTNVLSSFEERFTYNFSVPCDAVGKAATFTYTNSNPTSGGTFRMARIAAVNCSNSRNSKLPAGQFDTIQFTGFGTWSEDDDLHLATVHFSNAPDLKTGTGGPPYISIQIDGATKSRAHTKPPEKTFP